jgi:succinate dehydrogenase / fumarate reductase cytochrome b subunit
MAMSIAHRVTGSGLYIGTVLIAAWLVAAASGPRAFDTAQWIAGSIPGRLVLFLYSFVLIQHMLGGVRHLIWDTGAGYEPQARMKLAKYSLVASISLTVLIWIVALVLR